MAAARDKHNLRRLGITHILTVAEIDPIHPEVRLVLVVLLLVVLFCGVVACSNSINFVYRTLNTKLLK